MFENDKGDRHRGCDVRTLIKWIGALLALLEVVSRILTAARDIDASTAGLITMQLMHWIWQTLWVEMIFAGLFIVCLLVLAARQLWKNYETLLVSQKNTYDLLGGVASALAQLAPALKGIHEQWIRPTVVKTDAQREADKDLERAIDALLDATATLPVTRDGSRHNP